MSQKTIAAMLPGERKVVSIIALVSVLRMFALFSFLPVLALYAAGLADATPLLIGIAVGGYGLTQAALQLPFGALSDRIGRRPVILMGLAIFAIGSIVAGLSDSIYGVIAGRLLQGAGAISATLSALLADNTRPEIRTRSMALLGISIGSAFLLALVFGPVIAALTGPRSLFWLATAVSVIAAIVLLQLPKQPRLNAAPGGRWLADGFHPALLRLDAYIFLLHAVLTALFVALPFVLQDILMLANAEHWKIYVGALLLSLIGTVPLIFADERRGKALTMSIAIVFVLSGLLVLAFVGQTTVSVLLALTIFFAGFNFLEAGLPARLSIAAHEEARGAAMGVFASSSFLGAFVGGTLGGLMLADGDGKMVFVACASACAVWLLAHLLHKPFEKAA